MKTRRGFLFLLCFSMILPIHSGERTIPVDVFLMIDKSLSMAEPGKFDSMDKWVQNQLIDQILINDDWITIYQFYGKADHLLSLTVGTAADRTKVTETIREIEPDGQYTDIGLALDTIKEALDKRGTNGRLKILLLLTDLKQEAPWTSRYAGSPESFESPYLAEARRIQHDQWYEITLDMNIQDRVVRTSRELFNSIENTLGTEKDLSATGTMSETGPGTGETGATAGGVTAGGSADGNAAGGVTAGGDAAVENPGTAKGTAGGPSLPLPAILVIVFGIISACIAAILVILNNRKKKKEQTE